MNYDPTNHEDNFLSLLEDSHFHTSTYITTPTLLFKSLTRVNSYINHPSKSNYKKSN